MPIWKVNGKQPMRVEDTTLKKEKFLEENLEDWVEADPLILGEQLLIIGRQVTIPDVKDRLDLLALDLEGNAVVIELKRGKLKDPIDMQALRYASYVSKWQFDDFERQARLYLGKVGDAEFNFNEAYEEFCKNAGIEEVPDLNSDQRIIVMGSEIKDKLGSVALWLSDHTVNIKAIEIELFREGETTLLEPQIIIPLPVSRFADTGRISQATVSKPWIADGKAWHLDKRCSPKTREVLLKLDELIREKFQIAGYWGQKFYVSYKIGNYIWLWLNTHPNMLVLNFNVKAKAFTEQDLADNLGVAQYSQVQSQAEKISLGSSISIEEIDDSHDYAHLRVKEDFDLASKSFLEFLNKAYSAFPRQQT